MRSRDRKHFLIIVFTLVVFGVVVAVATSLNKKEAPLPSPSPMVVSIEPSKQEPAKLVSRKIIGKSVEGRNIDAYVYGNGATHLMFVGGIHGGYEWNSVLLAYKFIDYLKANPNIIPKNLTIAVIPSANPDGVYRVIKKEGRFIAEDVPNDQKLAESGRFNAHDVDLNRNFDCKWKPKGTWKSRVVSAGTGAFSEPETMAIRNFVSDFSPDSAIFWHSKAGTVYASKCEQGILPRTLEMMNIYARAAGYMAVKSFDAYEVSGDAEAWLASINIPAITVELETHETVEWERNFAGIKAILNYYNR